MAGARSLKADESEAREIDGLRAQVAELETERRRLAALVESSPVGVLGLRPGPSHG